MVGCAPAVAAATRFWCGSNSWPACARRPPAVRARLQVQGARYVDLHAPAAPIAQHRSPGREVERHRGTTRPSGGSPVGGGSRSRSRSRSPAISAGGSGDASTQSAPRSWAARSPEPASAPSSGGPPTARSGAPAAWIGAGAVGYAVGLAAGAALVGYDTDLGSLAVMGLVSGAVLGGAQGLVLAREGRRALALPWALAMPAALRARLVRLDRHRRRRRRPVHGVRRGRRDRVHAAQRPAARALHAGPAGDE